ncbi:MAG: PEP-CTERM sorting domain-containing protein, partial [Bryobacteraceae bacterium]
IDAFVLGGGNVQALRIGLFAAISLQNAGNDTFFVINQNLVPIPEPSTYLTLGSGLLLLAAFARKRLVQR